MNIKIVSIFSLLVITSFIDAMSFPDNFYYDYFKRKYAKAEKKRAQVLIDYDKALEKVYQTEKGQVYKQNEVEWNNCLSKFNKYSEGKFECRSFETAVEDALKNLKTTPEYASFIPFQRNNLYLTELTANLWGLSRYRFDGALERLYEGFNFAFATPISKTDIEDAEDRTEQFGSVYNKLCHYIEKSKKQVLEEIKTQEQFAKMEDEICRIHS